MESSNPNNPNTKDITIHNGSMTVSTYTIVKLYENIHVRTDEGLKTLKIEISADFNDIEPIHHEIFFNVLSAKYLGEVSFGDNPFSICYPTKKRKWYQFWREKIFI